MNVLTIRPNGGYSVTTMAPSSDMEQLKFLQKQVGGYIEMVQAHDRRWCAIVNEEGKIHGLEWNPIAEAWMRMNGAYLSPEDWIAGPVVFIGPPGPDGSTTGLPDEVANELADWLHTGRHLIKPGDPDPTRQIEE